MGRLQRLKHSRGIPVPSTPVVLPTLHILDEPIVKQTRTNGVHGDQETRRPGDQEYRMHRKWGHCDVQVVQSQDRPARSWPDLEEWVWPLWTFWEPTRRRVFSLSVQSAFTTRWCSALSECPMLGDGTAFPLASEPALVFQQFTLRISQRWATHSERRKQ